MARQARQAGRVLKCEPGTQSNNRAICPGNAHIHLTKDKLVWEQIKEKQAGGERKRGRGREEVRERDRKGSSGEETEKKKCLCVCVQCVGAAKEQMSEDKVRADRRERLV